MWIVNSLFIATSLLVFMCSAEYRPNRADQLLSLTHENFSEAIASNHMVLVDFYAPWCTFCTDLKSELTMVAMDLPNMNIDGRIAIMDASAADNEGISADEGVDGYPSIVLYRDGLRQGDYLGPRTRLDILEYLKKKAGPPAIPVSTREEIDKFLKQVQESSHLHVGINENRDGGDVGGETSGVLSVALALFLPELAESNKGVYGPVCKTIVSLASNYEQIQFLYADNLDLIGYYGITEDSLLIFTESSASPVSTISLNQEKVFANEMAEYFLVTSILSYSLPALIPYSTQTQPFINSLPMKKHVLIFHDYNERSKRVLEMLVPVTAPYRGTLAFITISSAEHQLMQYFGIEAGGVPELVIADMTDPLRMRRYHLRDYLEGRSATLKDGGSGETQNGQSVEGNAGTGKVRQVQGHEHDQEPSPVAAAYLSKQEKITGERVREFLDAFVHGSLTRTIFSEDKRGYEGGDSLETSGEPGAAGEGKRDAKKKKRLYAKHLVGTQFTESVVAGPSLPQNKDVLVYVHAPWCGHCKSFEPVIEDLARLYRRDENLRFYRIDGSKNEIDHDGVRIRGFPTIYLFPAGEKSSPIEYTGERDAASIAKFLKNFRTTRSSTSKDKGGGKAGRSKAEQPPPVEIPVDKDSGDGSGGDTHDGDSILHDDL